MGAAPSADFQYTAKCDSKPVEGGKDVYRHKNAKPGPLKDSFRFPQDGDNAIEIKTLYDNFQRGLQQSTGPCLGVRTMKDGVAGKYEWATYPECWARIKAFGSGMESMKLWSEAEENIQGENQKLKLLGIYAKNRPEWVIAEHACNAFTGVVVPLYDTLGPETLRFVINQGGLKTVLCGTERDVKNVLAVKAECPSLQAIICMDAKKAMDLPEAGDVQIVDFAEVEADGAKADIAPIPPRPEDVATFCYTSGTTGDPKGAMLTHRNIVAALASGLAAGILMDKNDIHLSYLPLPHMFERIVQAIMWSGGGRVGFYQGDTAKITEDLKALSPTIFPSVPRLFNKIYDKIVSGAESQGGLKAWLWNKASSSKRDSLRNNGALTDGLWDSLVFSKVTAKLGFQPRLMFTGSAPIAPHVMEFLRFAFSCPVCEGYGQTECAAAATLTAQEDQKSVGHVGGPILCCEIALRSVEEMGYLATDTEHEGVGKVLGRGEICIRGPHVFAGYFRNPEKTAEALDADGWLRSGDIGVWLPNGALKVVDRLKNIFKLAQGEYVAAEKLEIIYSKSPLIEQIFVYGNSFQASLVAIIVPDPDGLKAYDGGSLANREEASKSPAFNKAMLDELKALAKENKLLSYEIPRKVHVAAEPFSGENNTLTPTFKLKRKEAQAMYQATIDEMYAGDMVAGVGGLKQ